MRIAQLVKCTGLLLALWVSGVNAETTSSNLEVQVVPARDKIERNESVQVYLSVLNKSPTPVTISRATISSDAFTSEEKEKSPALPTTLAPFGSFQTTMSIKALNAKFGLHKLLLSIEYEWSDSGKTVKSAQASVVTLEVTRKFEEEAKGFPGGTAAFLYLLLPIIPFFLSYQTIERLRTGQGLRMPTFQSEYIVPAFFAAIIISFVMLTITHTETPIDYSNPQTFLGVLAVSSLFGAAIPAIRWGWNKQQKKRWGFSRTDSMAVYLEKALLGPRASNQFRWVKGKLNGEDWEGILLEQPNTAKLLGACLQASPKHNDDTEVYQREVQSLELSVLDRNGKVKDSQRLVNLAKIGDVQLNYAKRIQQGGQPLDDPVTLEMNNLAIEDAEIKPLVMLVE